MRLRSPWLLLLVLFGGGSCARQVASPTTTGDASRTAAILRTAAWELPSDAVGRQHLYRVRYDGPEGEVTVRVALRLESPYRFQLSASDRLGKRRWALDVATSRALWIDDDQEIACASASSVRMPGWTDGPIRLEALPAILLGAIPGGSSGRRAERRLPTDDGGTRLEFEDASGQRWRAELDGRQELRTWTLFENGRPVWWWRREGEGGRLSQRDGGRQLAWELVHTEVLGTPLTALEPPSSYAASCIGVQR